MVSSSLLSASVQYYPPSVTHLMGNGFNRSLLEKMRRSPHMLGMAETEASQVEGVSAEVSLMEAVLGMAVAFTVTLVDRNSSTSTLLPKSTERQVLSFTKLRLASV